MKLLQNRQLIRERRIARNLTFSKINRKKAIWKKWKISFFVGRNTFLKQHYVLSKKKRFFVQKNLARKFFILKKQLRLFCIYSPYNLFFFVRSPGEYLQMKTDLFFSNLGLLNFKFWHLKKNWVLELFKEHKKNLKHLPLLNGAVLVLKLDNLKILLETLLLFEHKNSVCVGVFFFNRMVWPSYFLDKILNVDVNLLALRRGIMHRMQNIVACFRVFFSLFKIFFKNANVIATNF